MNMVLSDNNESLKGNTPSGGAATPNPENPGVQTPKPNPGRRLRSIEMAVTRKKMKTNWPAVPNFLKFRKEKLGPAFINTTSVISLVVNIILIVVVLILSRQQFVIKRMLVDNVLGGLDVNFGKMDQASIKTDILVEDNIQVDFPLQIDQDTEVELTSDTTIIGARITLSTGNMSIYSAPTDIVLPAGTLLPIRLSLTVPVTATIPISVNVPVNIPLSGTELHEPFTNLQKVVQPYLNTFREGASSWEKIPACINFESFCMWWFK
jgi:hypothetical protein